MTQSHAAHRLPRWLDEYTDDPQRADLIALVQAIRRCSGDPRSEAGEELIALRVSPQLATSAGRELSIALRRSSSHNSADVPSVQCNPRPNAGSMDHLRVRQPVPSARPQDHRREENPQSQPRQQQQQPGAPVTISLALPDVPGLVGPTTPLPLPIAERAVGPSASAERLRQFLEPFQHRLLTQMIGGVSALRAPMPPPDASLWEARLLNAAGLGSPTSVLSRRHRRALLELLLSAYGPATAELLDRALTVVLRDLADAELRVRTQTLAHTSSDRPASTLSRLGTANARLRSSRSSSASQRRSSSSGAPLILGRRLRTRHGLRIKLDDLTPETVHAFAPGQIAHRRIGEVLRLLAPPGITWELELQLRSPGRLRARLGAARLGTTWLEGHRRPAPLRIVGTCDPPCG